MVGLIDASYLSISHFRVYTDMDYRSFCAISKAINCDTVSQSPYSIFLNVPVPIWGVIGYIVVSLLLFKAWGYRNAAHKLFWPSLFIIASALLDQQCRFGGDFIGGYPQPLHHVYLEPCGELLTAFLCVADP